MAAGTQVGSFHPLVAFADTERAVAALQGATIAVEGDDELVALLAEMAEAIGGTPVRLAPGTKPAYHAAAVLAAGGFVALLDAIAELGRVAGLDEAGALASTARSSSRRSATPGRSGIRAALTGPMTRGDAGTLEAHLAALRDHAPDVLPLYRAAAEREIGLAEERGALTPERCGRLADRPCKAGLTRYDCGHAARIAAKYAARPAARFVRPSPRARERRLGLRSAGTFQAVLARGDGAAPRRTSARSSSSARAGERSSRPAPDAHRAAGCGPSSRCTGRVRAARRGPAARAPPRRRGAAEDTPPPPPPAASSSDTRTEVPSSSSAAAAASPTSSPGPCRRARRTPARRSSRPRCARSPRRPDSRSGSRSPWTRSNTGSSSAAPGSTRPSTTS